jgi:hypothetical protein
MGRIVTAVLASVQTSADTAPFGLYAVAAVTFVVVCAPCCVLGVATVARLSAWRQRRRFSTAYRVSADLLGDDEQILRDKVAAGVARQLARPSRYARQVRR